MAHLRAQTHRLTWPLTPSQVESLDEMVAELYKRVQRLYETDNTTTTAAASTSPVGSQAGVLGFLAPEGDEGASGPPGPIGPAGLSGTVRVLGTEGVDGEDGSIGPPGPPGPAGASAVSVGGPWMSMSEPEDAFPWPFGPTPATPLEVTVTSTGNIDDLDFGNATTIRMNNASLATLRGMKAGTPGQRVVIVSVGAGEVDFAHQDAGSAASNRLFNVATSAVTPLAAGVGRAVYEYDGTTARWRLLFHDQGAAIGYTVTWSNTTTNPVLGNGTLTGSYLMHGQFVDVFISLSIGSTTTLGTGTVWLFSLPVAVSGTSPVGAGFVTSTAGTINNGCLAVITTFHAGAGEVFGLLTSSNANVNQAAPAGITTGDVMRVSVLSYPVA